MSDNIDKNDLQDVIDFLSQPEIPRLTIGKKVQEFEEKWAECLGVKYCIMVNSGASANELTMLALNYIFGVNSVYQQTNKLVIDVSIKNYVSVDISSLASCVKVQHIYSDLKDCLYRSKHFEIFF